MRCVLVLIMDNERREPAQAITQLGKGHFALTLLEVTLSLVRG